MRYNPKYSKQERDQFRRYPLFMADAIHERIDAALLDSTMKNKQEYIVKAIEEKLERDRAAANRP